MSHYDYEDDAEYMGVMAVKAQTKKKKKISTQGKSTVESNPKSASVPNTFSESELAHADPLAYTMFSHYAVSSSEIYLQFCKDKNKSTIITRVRSVKQVIPSNHFSLRLDKHPGQNGFDAGNIQLILLPGRSLPDECYQDVARSFIKHSYIRTVSFQEDSNTLTVEVDDLLTNIFANDLPYHPDCLIFIDDLTFLIERVKEWYENEKHKYSIALPVNPTPLIADTVSNLSDNQRAAVESVLSSSVSYIWGPPGTGKTWTLAHAIIQYMEAHKKVLVIAPTNNAIDQSLRTVLKVLNSQKKDLHQIRRLGIPTKEFYREYPFVCEDSSLPDLIEKALREVDSLENLKKKQNEAQTALSLISELKPIFAEYRQARITTAAIRKRGDDLPDSSALSDAIASMTAEAHQKMAVLTRIEQEEESISYRVLSSLNKKTAALHEKRKAEAMKEYSTCHSALEDKLLEYQKIVAQQEAVQQSFCEAEQDETRLLELIKEKSTQVLGNFISTTIAEADLIKCEKEYSSISFDDRIDEKIESARSHHEQLVEQAKHQGRDCLVLACTIDYAFGHDDFLRKTDGGFAHIFIDEAAYVPLIKAGIAFSFDAPVTLCGDHKQLPPVCEMDERLFKTVDYSLAFLWAQSALYFCDIFSSSMKDLYHVFIASADYTSTELKTSFLPQTFRFGDNLAQKLNDFVYGNEFKGIETNTRITILNSPLSTTADKRTNPSEVSSIREYLIKNKPNDYVILTPYKNQRELLLKGLAPLVKPMQIKTVHASQGMEWDTVIFSVVDRNDKYFCNSQIPIGLHVLNTAISRAKKEIVIACDVGCWRGSEKTQLIGCLTSEHPSSVTPVFKKTVTIKDANPRSARPIRVMDHVVLSVKFEMLPIGTKGVINKLFSDGTCLVTYYDLDKCEIDQLVTPLNYLNHES